MDGKLITIDQIKRVVKNAVSGVVLRGDFFPPEMHRTIFRGKNLGTTLTAKQKQAISDGTFEDLWLGDYWVINGITWRIVDIDYWLNTGNVAFLTHHLVIMPDTCLGPNKKMNDTNTTDGGYLYSDMRKNNIGEAKALVLSSFGENVLSHKDCLSSKVENGYITQITWVDSEVELPNEIMIYGGFIYGGLSNPSLLTYPEIATINKTQLSLFGVVPSFITNRYIYWLRDPAISGCFARVDGYGLSGSGFASQTNGGIRPVFAIGDPIGVPA